MVIASGHLEHPLHAIENGARCTWFVTAGNPVTARKKWIAGSLEPKGVLVMDAGAVLALRRGKSLLPAGVMRVEGAFCRGDAVILRGPDGTEVGRGLSAYDAEDAAKLCGKSSGDIALVLGFAGRSEMVHRDDLVLARE
jgi:glutamate 5-kinase